MEALRGRTQQYGPVNRQEDARRRIFEDSGASLSGEIKYGE